MPGIKWIMFRQVVSLIYLPHGFQPKQCSIYKILVKKKWLHKSIVGRDQQQLSTLQSQSLIIHYDKGLTYRKEENYTRRFSLSS